MDLIPLNENEKEHDSKSAEEPVVLEEPVTLEQRIFPEEPIVQEKLQNRKKNSWIWPYWKDKVKEIKGTLRQVMVCKVIEKPDDPPCGKTYIKSNGSTGNAINHLRNCHNITKNEENEVIKVCLFFIGSFKYFVLVWKIILPINCSKKKI